MVSNALTKNKVSIALPGICKPPPWPPAVPPPPLIQAKLWVFADLVRHPPNAISYGATCFCTWDPDRFAYYGKSSDNPNHKRVYARISLRPDDGVYDGWLNFMWPDYIHGQSLEWWDEPLPETRPYMTELFEWINETPWRRITMVFREVPT